MPIVSIRGAITVGNNTVDDIANATNELFGEIIAQNNIDIEDIIHIIFSLTKDLNAVYPAKVLRDKFDVSHTPLFCVQEADILNSLEKCIRILVLTNSAFSKKEIKHVYLREAKKLRPDLANN